MGTKQTTLLWKITDIVQMLETSEDDREYKIALSDIRTLLRIDGYTNKPKSNVQEGK